MDERATYVVILPIPITFSFWSVDVVFAPLLSLPPITLTGSVDPFGPVLLLVQPNAVRLAFEPTRGLTVPWVFFWGPDLLESSTFSCFNWNGDNGLIEPRTGAAVGRLVLIKGACCKTGVAVERGGILWKVGGE